jgi:hypothetical protein
MFTQICFGTGSSKLLYVPKQLLVLFVTLTQPTGPNFNVENR